METTKYSNPRLAAAVADWPSGSHRVAATFVIECNIRGERAVRRTQKAGTDQWNAPKALTYAARARIVDGDDGRIYIATLRRAGHITIFKGTFDYQHEVVFEGTTNPEENARYEELHKLFEQEVK